MIAETPFAPHLLLMIKNGKVCSRFLVFKLPVAIIT